MNTNYRQNKKYQWMVWTVVLTFLGTSCINHFLPESMDAYDSDGQFTTTIYKPVLGRTTLMSNNFNSGNSTLPLTFEITDITRFDGSEAPELTEYFPVKVWTTPYLGTEESLEEIRDKQTIEYRPLFQVRKHSGEFILWENALSSFVICEPDSGYLFTVRSENSGGYAYTTQMKLVPQREIDYEPSAIDPLTGLDTVGYVHPDQIYAMIGAADRFSMSNTDIRVYFREDVDNKDTDKTLTFRFFDSHYTPINPAKFHQTEWDKLIHGFDMEKTGEYVRYKVVYPIPLVPMETAYTNKDGDMASVTFRYDYLYNIGTYVSRRQAYLSFDFAIHREGHWEIAFVFPDEGPLFDDEN